MHIWLTTLILALGPVAAFADDEVPPHVSSFCATLLYSPRWATFGPPAEVPYYVKSLVLRTNEHAHALAAALGTRAEIGPNNLSTALIIDDEALRAGLVTLDQVQGLAGRVAAMADELERSHVVSVARFVRGADAVAAFVDTSVAKVAALERSAENVVPPVPPAASTRLDAAGAFVSKTGARFGAYLAAVMLVHYTTPAVVATAFDALGAWIISGPIVKAWREVRVQRKHELNSQLLWTQVFGPGSRLLQYDHVRAHIGEALVAPRGSPMIYYGGFSMITRELYDEFLRADSQDALDPKILRESIMNIGDRMLGAELFTVCLAFVDQAFFYDGDVPVLVNVVRLIDPLKLPTPPTKPPRREVRDAVRGVDEWLPGLRPAGA